LVTTGPKSIEWAAGIFEGEGCITYDSSNNSWNMKVDMTDDDVVCDFYDAVNNIGHYYGPQKCPGSPAHHKPFSRWRVNKKDYIFELVMLFYPYMYTRRRERMRDFLSWYFSK